MNNSIMVLKPYKYLGTWVFDDPSTGLVKEAFVAGVPEILEGLLAANGIPLEEGEQGFKLTFAAVAFPGFQLQAEWQREEAGGNWYKEKETGHEGWLCPALFKYFESAPAALFIRADRLEPGEQVRDDVVADVVSFIQRVATPVRPDGTYNYCREALEQQAKALLARLGMPQ
jgi:hypothetical protein